MKRKRTKKAYAALYNNPESLFPGVKTTLFPDGEPVIWFQTADGLGFRVKVNNGPAGLGLSVERFSFGGELTVNGNLSDGDLTPSPTLDMDNVGVTQYRKDARSQAFKGWYADPKSNPYPETEGDV